MFTRENVITASNIIKQFEVRRIKIRRANRDNDVCYVIESMPSHKLVANLIKSKVAHKGIVFR